MNFKKIFYIFSLSFFIIPPHIKATSNDGNLEKEILSGSEDTFPSSKKIYIGNISEFKEFLQIKKAQPGEQKELLTNYIDTLMGKLQGLREISIINKVCVFEELFEKAMNSLESSKLEMREALDKIEGHRPIIKELNFVLFKALIAAKAAAWDIKKIKRKINLNNESFETFELTSEFYKKHIIDQLTSFYLDAASSPHNNTHLNFLPFIMVPRDKLTGIISINLTFLNDMYIAYLPQENKCNIHTIISDRCAFLGHELFHMTAEGRLFFYPKQMEENFSLKEVAKEIFTNLLVTSYKVYKDTQNPTIYFKSHLLMFLLVHEGKLKFFVEDIKIDKTVSTLLKQIIKYYKNPEKKEYFIPGDYLLLYFFKELNYTLPVNVDMKKLPANHNEVIHKFLVNGVIDIAETLEKLYE